MGGQDVVIASGDPRVCFLGCRGSLGFLSVALLFVVSVGIVKGAGERVVGRSML